MTSNVRSCGAEVNPPSIPCVSGEGLSFGLGIGLGLVRRAVVGIGILVARDARSSQTVFHPQCA